MTYAPYTLTQPVIQDTSTVFSSPHSGRAYPASFLRKSVLDERTLRSSEDAFVDQLYDMAPSFGAPLLAASTPRAFVDLNRSADELDPALIGGLRRARPNARVVSGLGVVPRVVSGGREIYRGKMTLGEAQSRLVQHWHPYHGKLQALLDENVARFGEAILIDCHSMPHEAVAKLKLDGGAPEVVLGDRFGASARPSIVDRIEQAFQNAGFRTARNTPFAGAFVVQQYGRPSRRQHVVQVELDRSLYMDEVTITPNENFASIRDRLRGVISDIAAIGRSEGKLAAE